MQIVMFGKTKARTLTNLYFKRSFEKLGHKVRWIKFNKIRSFLGKSLGLWAAKKLTNSFRPDMFFIYASDIPGEILKEWSKKIPIVILYEDCIKGSGNTLPLIIEYGKMASVLYVTDTGELPFYQEQGIDARFITGGCDPQAHCIVPMPSPYYQSDVAFIGKPNTQDRTDFIKEIAQRFDLKLWGSGWEKHGLKTWKKNAYYKDYQKICSGGKIQLGWHIDPTVELYFSNRTWYTLGCGGFLLTQYSPKMEEVFKRGYHLDWFETLEESFEKIKYYLAHPEERKKIALQGYELAHKEYSFDKLAARIMDDVSKL